MPRGPPERRCASDEALPAIERLRRELRTVRGAVRLRDQWEREVRWSRCSRVSRPAGQLGYAITFTTPLAVALLAATRFRPQGWAALAASLALRWAIAAAVARETGDRVSRASLSLLPIRDLVTAAVWSAALLGRRVIWRGDAFRVGRDGILRPDAGPAAAKRAQPAGS